jgi:hypothetical protein
LKLADETANGLGMKKRFRNSSSVPVRDVQAVAGVVALNRSWEELEVGKEIVESKE